MCEGVCQSDSVKSGQEPEGRERSYRNYSGLPIIFMAGEQGQPPTPAPFLMSRDEAIRFLRLNESKTRFPAKAIQRYRHMGLRTVRVGRCAWYRLDDVLRFLDGQQASAEGRDSLDEKSMPADAL